MKDSAITPIDVSAYFDEIKRHKNIILFGCGGKGREAVSILTEYGIKIAAACDNNKALWNCEFLNGIIIQPFGQVVSSLEDCCVIITCSIIYTTEISRYLTSEYPSIPVYHLCNPYKIETKLLSETDFKEHERELLDSYNLLQDDESRKIFYDTLHWKLTGDMLPLNQYSLGYEAYSFFDEEFFHPDEQSVYVDVGAYTGDTIACFLMFARGKFKKIIGVEADYENYNALRQFVQFSRVKYIDTYNIALWSKEEKRTFYTNSINETIHFGNSNLFKSVDMLADNDSLERMKGKLEKKVLDVKTLDSLLRDDVPTIIKINALAADQEIILGGQQTLEDYKPTLLLEFGSTPKAVYEIIPLIKKINNKYNFYMRRKRVFEDIKTVLYCI